MEQDQKQRKRKTKRKKKESVVQSSGTEEVKRRRLEAKDIDSTIRVCTVNNPEAIICLIANGELDQPIHDYLIEALANKSGTSLSQILQSMLNRKVKENIMYEFMMELGRRPVGDIRNDAAAEVIIDSICARKRDPSPLLMSFELFWKNPLFFGVTRDYEKVYDLLVKVPKTVRTNILVNIYKTFESLYEKEPYSLQREEMMKTVCRFSKAIRSTKKKLELLRCSVPLKFLIIKRDAHAERLHIPLSEATRGV
jgi:hypothetical protein